MFQTICMLSLDILVLLIIFSVVHAKTRTLKVGTAPKWSIIFFALFLTGLSLYRGFYNNSRRISMDGIEADDIVGVVEGGSSSLLIYLDPSTGAPDYVLSTETNTKQKFSLGQVVFTSEVSRYAFKVIESTEKEYYILISGVAVESVVGEVGDVIVEDNLGSQFSVVKKSEQINDEHTMTRIIAFASLSCWDEKSYRLTVTDNFGVHEN